MKKPCIKSFLKLLISLSLIVSMTSCMSMADLDFKAVDQAIDDCDYITAKETILTNKNYYYTNKEKVLENLDLGLMQHFSMDYENSNLNLSEAESEIEKNFSKSISQSLGQMLVNDTVADYAGETYEDIYTNIFMCLNYIQLNDIENAMVEIRRFDNKMKVVGSEYQAVIDKQKMNMSSDFEKEEFSYVDYDVKFHNSAFARYLSMLLYRSAGDYDSAKIDLDKIKEAFKFQPSLYYFSMPSNLEEELEVHEDSARINFICFTGKSPIKVEEVIRIPFRHAYYKFAIPVMDHRPSRIRAIQAVLTDRENGQVYKANLHAIESIDKIACETYKQHFATIYARAIARSVGKAVKSGVYEAVAENTDDSNIRGLFSILNLFSQVSTEVTEKADTRISRYFPDIVSVAGINVPQGIYDVKVNFYNESKKKVFTYTVDNFAVKTGNLNLLEAIYQH